MMTLEELIVNKINAGETLSTMEFETYNAIKKIRAQYKTACEFIESAGDMSRYDGNTQKDNDMVNGHLFYSNQKSSFERNYPEIVLKKALVVEKK